MMYWVILESLWLHCLTMSYSSSLLTSEASCQTSTYNYIGQLKFYSLAQWIWLTYIWCKRVARWQIWIACWLRPEINEAYRLRYVLVGLCAKEEEVRDGVGYGARHFSYFESSSATIAHGVDEPFNGGFTHSTTAVAWCCYQYMGMPNSYISGKTANASI